MALDNVLAIFLLPVFSTLSDGTLTKLAEECPLSCRYDPGSDLHDVTADDRQCRKADGAHCKSFGNQVIFLAVLFSPWCP